MPFTSSVAAVRRGLEHVASRLDGYKPALLCLAMTCAFQWAVVSYLGGDNASGWIGFAYLMTLFISGWCGYGPGVLVVLLAVGVIPFFFRPDFSLSRINLTNSSLFILLSLSISSLAYVWKRNEQLLRRLNVELDARVREQMERLRVEGMERNSAIEALRVSEEQLRSFLTHIPGTAFIRDAEGKYLFGRPGWNGAGGESGSGEAGPLTAAEREVIAMGQAVQVVEEDRSGGKDRYWLVTRFPMTGPDGTLLIGGTASDISESKRLQEQLEQARKMEAIGHLAGGVAHDFNNLLTVINGYAEILLAQAKDGPTAKQLTSIAEAGERAAALTRQLLAFGRKQMLRPRDVDVNTLIGRMGAMVERLIPESIEVVLRLDPRIRTVHVDPTQMEQVLLNLVVNAKDAMPAGGRLVVETANTYLDDHYAATHPEVEAGEYVVISVSDNGIGIAPEIRDSVFEPFFTTKDSGTGLGLATVYGIVKQSRGDIFLYSEPGAGTTFKLYFPATERSAEPPETKRVDAIGGRERLLLVEDDAHVRAYCETILQTAGYEVFAAADGDTAISILSKERGIVLLITDVVLPHMAGPELAKRVRELQPGVQVLYVSGYTENTVFRHGLVEGMDEFLPKPYTREQMLTAIRRVLE